MSVAERVMREMERSEEAVGEHDRAAKVPQRVQQKISSKYQGVVWNKKYKRWQVHVQQDGKRQHIGYFGDEEEAANEYMIELRHIMAARRC
jgi:hypothetical protein